MPLSIEFCDPKVELSGDITLAIEVPDDEGLICVTATGSAIVFL
jgi:hypothetical protein